MVYFFNKHTKFIMSGGGSGGGGVGVGYYCCSTVVLFPAKIDPLSPALVSAGREDYLG